MTMEASMPKVAERPLTAAQYERAAARYLRSLPMEHFMEGIAQATQKKIILESLDILKLRVPDLQVFSELLIQYRRPGGKKTRRVVPDNMVRLHDEPPVTELSFNLELESVGPLWTLEWVSRDKDKDYRRSFRIYEKDLKVPYCLMFDPDTMDLRVLRHTGAKYEPIAVNDRGRQEIPELGLEIGLLDGWVRLWHNGELLKLPGDLQQDNDRLAQDNDRLAQDNDRLAAEVARLKRRLAQSAKHKNSRNGS
jgi:Uma2 family endonuclease